MSGFELRWVGPALAALVITPGLDAQATCELDWSLEETLRIGSVDGEDALTSLRRIAIGPDGDIYVPQTMLGSVLVFSENGRLLREIGQKGSGPGDFDFGPRIVTWAEDELWVADLRRAQSFGADDKPHDFMTWETRVPSEGSVYRPQVPLADGSVWATRAVTAIRDGDPGGSTLALRRFSRTGEILDTIAVLDARFGRLLIDEHGGFAAHPLWASLPGTGFGFLDRILTADRTSVVFVGEGTVDGRSATFPLLRIGVSGDTLLNRAIEYEPVRITRAERDWWNDEFAAFLAGDSTQGQPMVPPSGEAARNRTREHAREVFWLPDFYPPVRQILAGTDDTIWLLREFSVLEPADRWEVYDYDGELIGRVSDIGRRARFVPWLPHLQVLRASRTELWATTTDGFDVPYLHRFDVVPDCR